MLDRAQIEARIPEAGRRYDVLVAGGGPAGFGAAMAAALSGANTVLLEARGFLGGVAATSLWMPINRLFLHGKSRGGIHERLVAKLESYGPDACRPGKTTWTDGDGLHVHPDYLKLAMLELLEEAGCDYRLNSPVVGAEVEGGRVTGAKVAGKQGTELFSADVLIDCTGDGDLAYCAGADVEVGREGDGVTMPVTLGFALANVDEERLFAFYNSPDSERAMKDYAARAQAMGCTVSPWYSFDRTTVPGVVSVNNGGMKGAGRLCAVSPRDSTFGERAGIQIAVDFVRFARALKIPGLENCSLDRTGAAIGVRETRRVMCDYVLTLEDAQKGAAFGDPVARRYGAVDQAGLDESDAAGRPTMRSGHMFPYRALIVRNLEGLLAAGRCGSYTHMALAAGKSMGNMMAIGQAAGVAAAAASRRGVTPRQLPYEAVREGLEALNVHISLDEEAEW